MERTLKALLKTILSVLGIALVIFWFSTIYWSFKIFLIITFGFIALGILFLIFYHFYEMEE